MLGCALIQPLADVNKVCIFDLRASSPLASVIKGIQSALQLTPLLKQLT